MRLERVLRSLECAKATDIALICDVHECKRLETGHVWDRAAMSARRATATKVQLAQGNAVHRTRCQRPYMITPLTAILIIVACDLALDVEGHR